MAYKLKNNAIMTCLNDNLCNFLNENWNGTSIAGKKM